MTPLEQLVDIHKKQGAKAALEYYHSLSEQDRQACIEQMDKAMLSFRETWAVIETVFLNINEALQVVVKSLAEWWDNLPDEYQRTIAEATKHDA